MHSQCYLDSRKAYKYETLGHQNQSQKHQHHSNNRFQNKIEHQLHGACPHLFLVLAHRRFHPGSGRWLFNGLAQTGAQLLAVLVYTAVQRCPYYSVAWCKNVYFEFVSLIYTALR